MVKPKLRLVIEIDGGLVVKSAVDHDDVEIEVMILDRDTEGSSQPIKVCGEEDALIYGESPEINPGLVDEVFALGTGDDE